MRGLLLAFLLLAGPVMAQPIGAKYGPGDCPFNSSSCLSTATGSTTARTSADRAAERINIKDFGAKGGALSYSSTSGSSPGTVGTAGTIAAGDTLFTASAATFTAADVGKAITINGAGAAAAPLATTIASFVSAHVIRTTDTATTATPQFQIANCTVTTDQSGAGSYAPADTVTLAGGTGTAAVCTVQSTQVHGATVNAGGSGGTTGACIVTGTTGTTASGLGRFQLNTTVSGGAITAIGSFVTQGIYSVNPTSLSAEPVTGCGLTGATLTLKMGIRTAYQSSRGLYSVMPTEPTSQGSTSGVGTGATISPLSNATGSFTYGWDDSAATAAAITYSNTRRTLGIPSYIYIPEGNYLIRDTPLPIFVGSGGVVGEGSLKSTLLIDSPYSGDVFSWSEAWFANYPFNGVMPSSASQSAGPYIRGLSIMGNITAPVQQNAFVFYDREDQVRMDDVSMFYIPGRAIWSGTLKNFTQSYMRESAFSNIKISNAGLPGIAAVEFEAVGGGNGINDLMFHNIQIYATAGTSFWIHPDATSGAGKIFMTNLRIEGLEWGASGNAGDLLLLGASDGTGNLSDIQIRNSFLIDPYFGGAALHVMQPTGPTGATYGIVFAGSISGGSAYGAGLWLQGGRNSEYYFDNIQSDDYNIKVDTSSFVGGQNFVTLTGASSAFTQSIDTTSLSNILYRATRNAQTGPPSGANAVIGGGVTNTASGTDSVVGGGLGNTASNTNTTISGGQANVAAGANSIIPGGLQATDRGHTGVFGWASGFFGAAGDAQGLDYLLRGTSSSASSARGTSNGAAASTNNCVNIPTLTTYLLSIDVVAMDHTTAGNNETWNGWSGIMARPSNAASTTVAMNTTPTPLTNGTVAGSAIAATADTTNGCLNLSFTPPTANTDNWRFIAKVRTVQVQ